MYKNKTFIAIIPARSGSKRLPNKNILKLGGKPLIAWTIEAALKSKYIDETIVSTDREEIAKISQKYGANIPFLRPKSLATDTASTIDVVKHAINFYSKKFNKHYDYTILLQPTSPLRNHTDINSAITFLEKKDADAVISVCEMNHSPLWTNILPTDLSLKNFLNKSLVNKRSQDLPLYYRINGAIYICKTDILIKKGTFFISNNIYAYIMGRKKSIDIDDEIDFETAKVLLNKQ